jgi:hypothetical protein
LYCLDSKGRDIVAEYKGLAKREVVWERWDRASSLFFLEHVIALNDFRITVTHACERANFRLLHWYDDHFLRSETMRDVVDDPLGGGAKIPIVPDSWVQLELPDGKRFSCFVELDRNTEERKQFTRKIRGYLVYWESGAYLRKYQTKGLTILTVVSARSPVHNDRRMRDLKAWTEAERSYGRADTFTDLFWFAPLPVLTSESVLHQPVWTVAGTDALHQLME